MKNNIIILFFVMCSCFVTAQQIKSYTVQQIKDTVAKYDDIFTAYDILDKGTRSAPGDYINRKNFPSYDSIRNDLELKKSLLGLLDMEAYRKYLLNDYVVILKKEIKEKRMDSLGFIGRYLADDLYPDLSSAKIRKMKDSIKNNKVLFDTYFNVAFDSTIKFREKNIMNNSSMFDQIKYVRFLYPTQWQEVIDYIKENWEDTYPLSFKNKVLIEMNDQKAMTEFEQYFTKMLNTGELDYEDYIFANKFYYNKNFKIKLFLKILQCPVNYYVDFFNRGEIITTENDDYIPLKEDVFRELISYPLKKEDFMTNGKPDYNKVIQYFEPKIKN